MFSHPLFFAESMSSPFSTCKHVSSISLRKPRRPPQFPIAVKKTTPRADAFPLCSRFPPLFSVSASQTASTLGVFLLSIARFVFQALPRNNFSFRSTDQGNQKEKSMADGFRPSLPQPPSLTAYSLLSTSLRLSVYSPQAIFSRSRCRDPSQTFQTWR